MNCIPWIRLRIRLALGGILMPRAFSTARHEATACTTVQTPQIRWVKAQASRGSRPVSTCSIPRNWVALAQASAIRPFSSCTSIRRWPSIRVVGSTTTLVLAMVRLLPGRSGFHDGEFLALPEVRYPGHGGMGHHAGCGPDGRSRPDQVHPGLDPESADIDRKSTRLNSSHSQISYA